MLKKKNNIDDSALNVKEELFTDASSNLNDNNHIDEDVDEDQESFDDASSNLNLDINNDG